ncbi:hypothetical protein HHK36_017036 [Tetracentron sinense]|uniref:Uncharacterized protein n=1 Tax=Tetracentron sinense TaxID=13715 RepID=A0A834Z3U8_TETSI|nr:hypothetical protein HHK36_017036 [Tetracentron sinense]
MDRSKEAIKEAMGGQRYERRDSLDPITLRDIDECNEWLIGSMQELVYEDDDLTWTKLQRLLEQVNNEPDILGPTLTCKGEVQVEACEELLKKNHYFHQMR